jgi:hypothetical protein
MSSRDYRAYAAKEITPTMVAFAEWLAQETGYEVDARTVYLAGSLRGDFQKSDFWKGHEANYLANVEANREVKARERADAAKVALAKATERAKVAEQKAQEAAKAARAKIAALEAKAADAKAA